MECKWQVENELPVVDIEQTFLDPTASPPAEIRLKRECSRDHICENTLRNTPALVSPFQCVIHVALSKSI